MNRVAVSTLTRKRGVPTSILKQNVLKALRFLGLRKVEVSLLLTTDLEIARLNRGYRGMARPTDVLSFSQNEPAQRGKRLLLGDIAISVQTARRQALRAKHSLSDECTLLAIHGLLHLLGHDHEKRKEAEMMFFLQNRILERLLKRV